MAYCVLADIQAEIPQVQLIQLTDDTVPPVAVNQPVVDKAIADASDIINAYVGERYQVPITIVPALVKNMAVDLAVYRLFLRRKKQNLPEAAQKAYDNTMRLLRDVQAGRLSLGVSSLGQAATPTGGGEVQSFAGTRTFTSDTLKDY